MRQIFASGPGRPADPPDDQLALATPGQSGAAVAATLAVLADLYAYPETASLDAGPRRHMPWVRANMIASADGAAELGGQSGSLSGSGDRMVFSVLRSLADVILVGAGTASAEGYRPVQLAEVWPSLRDTRAATPPIAVVTSQMAGLDPGSPLLAAVPGGARTIVLTTERAPASRRAAAARTAEVIVAGADRVSPAAAIAALADRGYQRILSEGGPRLLGQIVAAGLLDELCLTVSPQLVGGQAGRILAVGQENSAQPGALASLRLAHVLEHDGYLLTRYLRPAPDASQAAPAASTS